MDIFYEISNMLEDISSILTESNNTLDAIIEILGYVFLIAETSIVGIIILVSIIGGIISFIFGVVFWIIKVIPYYKLSKNAKRKCSWLAFVPILGSVFRMFVLSDIPGDMPFVFFKKLKPISRTKAFLIYIIVYFFGEFVMTAIIAVLSFIPVSGNIVAFVSYILRFVPLFTCLFMEFVFTKDVINYFKGIESEHTVHAIILIILNIFTYDLASVFYFYSMLKRKPQYDYSRYDLKNYDHTNPYNPYPVYDKPAQSQNMQAPQIQQSVYVQQSMQPQQPMSD